MNGDGRVETGRLLQELRIKPEQREGQRESARGRRIGPTIFLLIVAGGGGGLAIVGLRGGHIPVETAAAVAPTTVDRGSTTVLQATGYVTARRQATVSAQITGTLTDVLIEEGEHVKAGQVLARLENEAQSASLAQAQAQFNAAQALLGEYDAQLEQARRDLKRDEDLVARHLVSEQALEAAATQVRSFEAQTESQRRQIDLAQAAVKGAKVELGYTTIRAPFAGVIVAKAAQPGEIVAPGSAGGGFTRTGVGTIVDMDSLEIEVDVNESYLYQVTAGQVVQATLDAYPHWDIPAHVIAIIPTADRSKATVKVRIGLDQKDPRILPDMGVRVSFQEDSGKRGGRNASNTAVEPPTNGVLVPASAVVERVGNNVVFTVDGNSRVHAQQVSLGQTYGDFRMVEGVSRDTQVVLVPPDELSDGAHVAIKEP